MHTLTKKQFCFESQLQGTASFIVVPFWSRASLEFTEASAAHSPAQTDKENPPLAGIISLLQVKIIKIPYTYSIAFCMDIVLCQHVHIYVHAGLRD